MKYLICQPDTDFYLWQLQVQMHNFRRHGIEQDAIIIFSFKDGINSNAAKFARKTKAKCYFYKDDRDSNSLGYGPNARINAVKKFFGEYKINGPFMYLDCDVIFREVPDYSGMREPKVYVSDAASYLHAKYINSKGDGLISEMADIVGISIGTLLLNDVHCGGAQLVFNIPVTYAFWDKVERDSWMLYKLMNDSIGRYEQEWKKDILRKDGYELRDGEVYFGEGSHPIKYHPIQSYTADMWALLWNIWQRGYETEIHPELDFCWATTPIKEYLETKIMHNAGATSDRKELFHKGSFLNTSPFGSNFDYVSPDYCSRAYVNELIEAKEWH